ncbi:hypothetical protein OHA18_42055 [Kribbella sp. NBC_00709]
MLLPTMIIVGILRRTGMFEYVAIWAAKRAKGSPLRIRPRIGGTATLIGDPPNIIIIIASRSGLTFDDFLIHLTPVIGIAAPYLWLRYFVLSWRSPAIPAARMPNSATRA